METGEHAIFKIHYQKQVRDFLLPFLTSIIRSRFNGFDLSLTVRHPEEKDEIFIVSGTKVGRNFKWWKIELRINCKLL